MVFVSVILPCRNEEKTIERCIRQIKKTFAKEKIKGEIIVSDSSSDRSAEIAKKSKVRVVKHNKKGYGIAIIEGVKISKGEIIIIGDCDATYNFSEIPRLASMLDQGNDLVIGTRIKGRIRKNAMPWHHRYIGNPLLSFLLNVFFRANTSDSHSGFRAITRKAFNKLNLKTTGMEFASEMIIKAAKNNLKIAEVPISYSPRIGESKLNSFSDGWRHLRFMLMFSPTYLFILPGSILSITGFILMLIPLLGIQLFVEGIYLSLAGSAFSILGYQTLNLGLYSRIYAIHTGFEKQDKLTDKIAENIPLERGIMLGSAVAVAGLIGISAMIWNSLKNNLLIPGIILGLTLLIIGIQTMFSVFFISMMLVEKRG